MNTQKSTLQIERQRYITEHDQREKEILRFFNDVLQESRIILLKTDNGSDRIPPRLQMIIVFSLIDMLGSYWYEYLGKTGKTSERTQDWYKRFCATESNEYYKKSLKEISAERLYIFRNSLVHFFGLGGEDGGMAVALVPNNFSEVTKHTWETEFLKRGKKSVLIRPCDFYNLVRNGALLMFNEWQSAIAKAQTDPKWEEDYICGIERVWSKVQQEGAIVVSYNP